jgi:hypothetical protein
VRYRYLYDAKSPANVYWRVNHGVDVGSELQISKDNGRWYTVKYFDVSVEDLTDLRNQDGIANTILGDALVYLMRILAVAYDDHYELREWK